MDEVAINVTNVSKSFKLPHEKKSSVKSAFINFYKRGKSYELQEALKDVSFEVKKGEFFGIVGRNGSGKSTLLKMLAGIYTPTTGNIQVNGKLTPFIELGVGFNPELTGRENVYLNGALLGFNRQEMRAMYKDIVDFAEIHKFMDQKLKNYSSGMQVRLAFSIAIRAESDILLIDEVLAVGDAAFQAKCFDYFRRLKDEGRTVVFVSHDMSSVQEFCDRAILIDNGKLVLSGKTADVASRYLLNSATGATPGEDANQAVSPSFEFIKVDNDNQSGTYKPKDTVRFDIHYRLKKKLDYDLGISVQKNNVSLHEKNTKGVDLPLGIGAHVLRLEVPAKDLLGGLHELNVAAFTREDFKLIAYVNSASNFFIDREEKTIGGMVDLSCNWKVVK